MSTPRCRWWTVLVALALTAVSFAQDATTIDPVTRPGFESPRATMESFLVAMQGMDPDLDLAAAFLDTSGVSSEVAPDLANKLYRSLNRILWIDLDQLPDAERLRTRRFNDVAVWRVFPTAPNMRVTRTEDRARVERVRNLVPEDARIELVRGENGEWLFSAETVAGIEALWESINWLPPVDQFEGEELVSLAEQIEGAWPDYFVDNRFLGIKYWKWLTLGLLILTGLILDLATRIILAFFSRRIITRQGGVAASDSIKRTVRPFGLAVAGLFWLWTARRLDLPSTAYGIIIPAIRFFAMLAFVWSAYRLTDLITEVFVNKAEQTDNRFDDLVVPLIRKTLKVFITIFGLIYFVDSLDVSIAPLLTGLGIGGAGFAFAAKDTLEHIFGSVTIIADRPFQVGDWITIGDVEGTVEEVGFRSTRVRTFYNSLVTVPNGNLVRAVVDNYGERKYRRWTTHLNIEYGTPPDSIDAFCEGVRELIRIHPYTRKDYYQVWLHQMGPHSLDILVYLFFECPDWSTELRERHRFILDTIRLADRLGVGFAFPTQTLHVSQVDPETVPDTTTPPERGADYRAARLGRKTVRELTENALWREHKPGPYRFGFSGDSEDEDGDDTQIESKIGGDA